MNVDQPLLPCLNNLALTLWSLFLWVDRNPQITGPITMGVYVILWAVWCLTPNGPSIRAFVREPKTERGLVPISASVKAFSWLFTGPLIMSMLAMGTGMVVFSRCVNQNPGAAALMCQGVSPIDELDFFPSLGNFVWLVVAKAVTYVALILAACAVIKTIGTGLDLIVELRKPKPKL